MLVLPTFVDLGSHTKLVRGLRLANVNFSLSYFLGAFWFSSLNKIDSQLFPSGCGAVLRGHAWVMFWGRAPSRHSSTALLVRPHGAAPLTIHSLTVRKAEQQANLAKFVNPLTPRGAPLASKIVWR